MVFLPLDSSHKFLSYGIPPTQDCSHSIPTRRDSSQTELLPHGIPPKRYTSQTIYLLNGIPLTVFPLNWILPTVFIPHGIPPTQDTSHGIPPTRDTSHGIPPKRDTSPTTSFFFNFFLGCKSLLPIFYQVMGASPTKFFFNF